MARLIEALEKQGKETQGPHRRHSRVHAQLCPAQSAPRASLEPNLPLLPAVFSSLLLPQVEKEQAGSALTPLSPLCPGLDSEVLYRSGPGVLGDAELKQALLAGESQRRTLPCSQQEWGLCR